MVTINAPSSLESFRRFIMASTCNSFAPRSYLDDPEVFPTREDDKGSIYVDTDAANMYFCTVASGTWKLVTRAT